MSNRIKIIADDKIPFLEGVFEPIADIEYYPGSKISNDILKKADAVIVRTRTKCNKELLFNTNVKIIATATIGTDHIDKEYCDQNNIKWLNAPGCNSSSVMQYVASALMQLTKKFDYDFQNITLGIVGVGNVGEKIKKLAEILRIKVLQNDPPRQRKEGGSEFVELDTIINESDIITFHVPLTKTGIDKTFHLADNCFFEKFDRPKILINSSRGEVVESGALIKALGNNKVSDAVLDVWESEPIINLDLLNKVFIGTPHIAGYSADGKANGTAVCVNTIADYFGLDIPKNWYPNNIPYPDHSSVIKVDCNDKTNGDIIHSIINQTYNVSIDHELLIKFPHNFEQHRGDYYIRREFPFFNVKLNSPSAELLETIKLLGFNIETD